MRVVFTGSPCSGKSTVFEQMLTSGRVFPELARDWLSHFEKHEPKKHPSSDRDFFQKFIESQHKKNYLEVDFNIVNTLRNQVSRVHIYDRGLVDEIAYRKKFSVQQGREDLIRECKQKYRYDLVFFFPYWEEIYQCDSIRKERPEEALELMSYLQQAYHSCDYKESNENLFVVPFTTIEERVKFIREKISLFYF